QFIHRVRIDYEGVAHRNLLRARDCGSSKPRHIGGERRIRAQIVCIIKVVVIRPVAEMRGIQINFQSPLIVPQVRLLSRAREERLSALAARRGGNELQRRLGDRRPGGFRDYWSCSSGKYALNSRGTAGEPIGLTGMHAVTQTFAEDNRKVSLVCIAATNYARIIRIRICRTNEL